MEEKPFVISGKFVTWKCYDWTPDKLTAVIQKNLSFRLGRKNTTGIQYETDCEYVKASISDFNEWLSDRCEINTTKSSDTKKKPSPFLDYNKDSYWGYADYKYMKDLFSNEEILFDLVDWSTLGLPGRNGKDSTFWYGSQGANTVCHYDTYGCNLVAQIYGRKRWTLFPPDQSPLMYPTRIPYEESSVFSQVNIQNPDLCKNYKYKTCTPYVVVLEPGDVLYVPRHWWHFVECLDTAISINTWLEMDEDKEERVKEAVTRSIVFGLMQDTTEEWLNPTEDDTRDNTELLNGALQELPKEGELAGKSLKCNTEVEDCSEELLQMFINFVKATQPTLHHCKCYSFEDYMRHVRQNEDYLYLSCESLNPKLAENEEADTVPCKKLKHLSSEHFKCREQVVNCDNGSACEIPEEATKIRKQSEKTDILISDIVNCIVDKEVILLITKKLKEKYTNIQL